MKNARHIFAMVQCNYYLIKMYVMTFIALHVIKYMAKNGKFIAELTAVSQKHVSSIANLAFRYYNPLDPNSKLRIATFTDKLRRSIYCNLKKIAFILFQFV